MTQYTIALRCRDNKYYPTGIKNVSGVLQLTGWQNTDANAISLPYNDLEALVLYHNANKPETLPIAGIVLELDQPHFCTEIKRVYEVAR